MLETEVSCIIKSRLRNLKNVLGVILGPLSNGVVCFLLSVHFDPFCKTVTEVEPHFVKNEKNDITQ